MVGGLKKLAILVDYIIRLTTRIEIYLMECPYKDEIVVGDCLEVISKIPDKSVNLVITSPPYFNQRSYTDGDEREFGTEEHFGQYLTKIFCIFKECFRVTKDDGSIIFNMGDKYVGSSLLLLPYQFALMVTREIWGVRLINDIVWHKTNPTPRQYQRRLVSSHESFFHFVKSDNYYYNSSAFDEKKQQRPSTERMGKRYYELIEEAELNDEEKEKARKALGRVVDKVKRGELWSFRMKIRGVHKLAYGGNEGGRNNEIKKSGFSVIEMPGKIIQKDVFTFPTEKIRWNKHPAIYPEALIRKLVLLTTREGDLVLDPFIGSGSTALSCVKTKRHYIGIELVDDFAKVARERIAENGC